MSNMRLAGYEVYKEQSIYTMTRGELLLTVYDELLKRLGTAEMALKKKDDGVFGKSLQKSRDIVNYLVETLDFQYPISRELKRMYDFFLYELARLDASRNPQIIEDIRPLVKDLRDAFAQAEKAANL